MSRALVVVVKGVIAASLAGSLLVQVVIVPLLWVDLEGEALWGRISFTAIIVLGIVSLQVCAVCIWKLLTLVGRGAVFSSAAFRLVDTIIGAVASGAVLAFALAVVLAPGDTAPGVVGLLCGAAFVIGGVALLVVVMRTLLVQAIDRENEARRLRDELSAVI